MTKKAKQVDLPVSCPLCGESIEVTRVRCAACASEINGSFRISEFTLLPVEYQKFITVFLRHRGNISAVEKELGIRRRPLYVYDERPDDFVVSDDD